MENLCPALLPCPGYDTDVFLTIFRHFAGTYGQPRVIYSDHAPSLVKASGVHDWAEIGTAVTATGSEWRLTGKGCSWRNGLAERVIRSARHTLVGQLRKGELIDFHQFGSVLSVVSAIINMRPLSLRTTPDGGFQAISPRDVLLGRAGRLCQNLDTDLEAALSLEEDTRMQLIEDTQSEIVREWRKSWLSQVFADMVPRSKWKTAMRNVREGDVGHVHYDEKLGPQSWRIARVKHVKTGKDGLVRTITVCFRPRHVSDKGKAYKSKTPNEIEIGIQRFAVLLPVEEQSSQIDAAVGISDEPGPPPASEMMEN